MGQCKDKATQLYPRQHPKFNLKGVHPDWEMHPSWINGIEALNAYNLWVCEVMMPVAFQWIEDHHDEVYDRVPEEHRADVGVVMAVAFDIVKQLPSYQRWMGAYEKFKDEVDSESFNPAETNPVWTRIVQRVRRNTEEAFAHEAKYLKDTIR